MEGVVKLALLTEAPDGELCGHELSSEHDLSSGHGLSSGHELSTTEVDELSGEA